MLRECIITDYADGISICVKFTVEIVSFNPRHDK